MRSILISLFLLLVVSRVDASTAVLKDMLVAQNKHHIKVEMNFSVAAPKVHVFSLNHPHRLVFDIDNASFGHDHKMRIRPNFISDIRFGYFKKDVLRIVLELKGSVTILNKKTHGDRYTIYFKPKKIKSVIHHPKVPVLVASKFMNRNVLEPSVVLLDPGHGGKDPGATGFHGVHEKNVVLAVAKYVRSDLTEYAGVHVEMTRTGDYFVTLRGRLMAARKDKANLFMAIHADAYPTHDARGASVFALSQHGATSEAALWLARSENYAVLGGAQFKDQNKDVQSVLLNLSQTATIKDSLGFGLDVMKQLAKVTELHAHRVEQAPFMVLKSPDIPSILVETGFLSNRSEERRLNTRSYQKKLAHALSLGVLDYLYRNPPVGSVIAAQQSGKLVIKTQKTETVNQLAKSYCISVACLKSANHFSGNSIAKGKEVRIPRSDMKNIS